MPTTRMLLFLMLAVQAHLWGASDVEKASRLIKERALPEARLLLDQAVKRDPRNAEAWFYLGKLQLATDNPSLATEMADKAIQLDPTNARFHLLRGNALGAQVSKVNVLRQLFVASDCRRSFEKAVQLDPRYREARLQLFKYYLSVPGIAGGSPEKAKAFAEQTLGLDVACGHYMRGLILHRKDPGAAQAEYRLALAADPTFPDAYNELGYVELGLKQLDMALEHFHQRLALEPASAEGYDSLGDGWMAKGSLGEAIQAYRQALRLNPLLFPSMRSLGKALEQAGRKDEAIQHYRQCSQLGVQKGIPPLVSAAKERLKALGANG